MRKKNRLINSTRSVGLIFIAIFATVLAARAQVPPDSRLKTIANTKTIKIAYRDEARPFSFLNDQKQIAGFTIDICKLLVGSIQQQLDLDQLKIEWVPVTVSSRFSAVASGKADMECGSSSVTLGRMKEVDFSNYIFIESTGILVKQASNFRSFADLATKKIAVVAGTTNQSALDTQIKQQKVEATVVAVKDRDEGVAMLEAGSVDGYASDKLLLLGANIKDRESLIMLPDDLSVEPYAIVLPRGDWAFRLAVNTGLAKIFRTGQIVPIVNGWFGKIGIQTGPVLRIMYGLGSLSD
jgi:glutamate/aspartate transport system substrate-binding protein